MRRDRITARRLETVDKNARITRAQVKRVQRVFAANSLPPPPNGCYYVLFIGKPFSLKNVFRSPKKRK